MSARTAALFICFRAACLASVTAVCGAQTTIHVPMDQPSIQAGINAAQNGDTVLVAPGIYAESIDFKGKDITVTSGATSYEAATPTVIQSQAAEPAVTLQSGEPITATLNGFTITHGVNSIGAEYAGTGVYLNASSATLTNNVIQGNAGCGVLSVQAPGIILQGNHIVGQRQAAPLKPDCASSPDRAFPGTPAVLLFGGNTATISGNLVEDNTTISYEGVVITATNTVIAQDNTIRNNGGTCGASLTAAGVGSLSITQNLIYGNYTSVKLTPNPTVSGTGCGLPGILIQPFIDGPNSFGGSISTSVISLVMLNNTVFGNYDDSVTSPYNQPSLALEMEGTVGNAVIANNLFLTNLTQRQAVRCALYFNDAGTVTYEPANIAFLNNDIYGPDTPQTYQCATISQGNLSADPLFVSETNLDFHTARNSPVVAAGRLSVSPLPNADLDDKARTVCGMIDMGVYEVHPQPPITVTSSQNPSVGGTAVNFTANFTGNCNVPTGTVTFYDGATLLGTQTLSAGASASLTTSALTVGSHNITVGYPGDFNFDASTSATLVQVVTGYPTATTLTVSPNPANAFGSITLSSGVTSGFGVPNGTVTFTAGGTVLATATLNANGQATATISSLGAGSYPIVATYSATTTYASSSSASVNETVVGAESITALSATPNPAAAGQTVNFTVTVKAAQGSVIPTGTVVFTDGTATLGTSTVNAGGAAIFTTATLAPGTHSITATYSGGANFNPSSASITEIITVVATAANLSTTPNPAGFGQTVTLTATILAATSGVPPNGVVTFLDGGTAIGTGTLSAAGVATFSTSMLAVGTHSLTATYPGAVSLGGSTSPAVSETILASTFSLALTPSSLTLRPGQTGTVTVQLASAGGYAGTLTLNSGSLPTYVMGAFNPGSVTLQSNDTATSTFTLSTQVAQAQIQALRPGRDVMLAGGLLTCLLAPLGFLRRRRISLVLLFGLATTLLTTNGCTNLGYAIHTVAPGTYTIPVTATDAKGNQKISIFTLVIAQ